jgi:hypothetical protein
MDIVLSPGNLIAKLPVSVGLLPNAQSVQVRTSTGADGHPASAVVATTGTITGLNLAASAVMVDNADTINVADLSATVAQVTFGVAGGVFTSALFPSATKIFNSGVSKPVTGGSGVAAASAVSITFTIVNGSVTAFVLA